MGGCKTLQPGESIKSDTDLSKYLILDKPGIYLVRGSCPFEIIALDTHKTLWDDYATGEFQVKIK